MLRSTSRSAVEQLAMIVLLMLLVPILDGNSQPVTTSTPLQLRDTTPVNVCFRFSGQSAVVNGTLYLYGGQVATQQGQQENTWSNNFYSLDLTKSWQISNPALTGLPQANGPPAVALGTLWSSHEALFLYGGEFSWKPPVSPAPLSLWEYDLKAQTWNERQNPQTSDGHNAPNNNAAVQRAAEGASANVPSLGRGFYFGGHLDGYTTPGWSQSIARVYLQSLLEFTFPGFTNDQVNALSNNRKAGTYGNYRNITEGGVQSQGGFTARADGLLVFVPGFGKQGILIALAGGTDTTYTQMNNLDIYDIASSTWYKQYTTGTYPELRVNPCAVVAAAEDGSSYNIYMFGGQKLLPYGSQEQYSDMWILSVPSFSWISINNTGAPYGRSGHICQIWDAQMVVIGGYTGEDLSCESPGVYIYDLGKLQWIQQFNALSSRSTNPFSQQQAQLYDDSTTGGLEGSYGYQVPAAVISVIGGGPNGGATLTTPLATPSSGPLATGSAVTYTVSGSTTSPTGSATETGTNPNTASTGPNIGAIVAGVIAGLLFLLVCYLLFCTWIYRKQVHLYRRHAEMAQRQSQGEKLPASLGLLATNISDNNSERKVTKPGHASWATGGQSSQQGSGHTRFDSQSGSATNSSYNIARRSSSTDDLLSGNEPTFVGVMLNPRRSLRVINKD